MCLHDASLHIFPILLIPTFLFAIFQVKINVGPKFQFPPADEAVRPVSKILFNNGENLHSDFCI